MPHVLRFLLLRVVGLIAGCLLGAGSTLLAGMLSYSGEPIAASHAVARGQAACPGSNDAARLQVLDLDCVAGELSTVGGGWTFTRERYKIAPLVLEQTDAFSATFTRPSKRRSGWTDYVSIMVIGVATPEAATRAMALHAERRSVIEGWVWEPIRLGDGGWRLIGVRSGRTNMAFQQHSAIVWISGEHSDVEEIAPFVASVLGRA